MNFVLTFIKKYYKMYITKVRFLHFKPINYFGG